MNNTHERRIYNVATRPELARAELGRVFLEYSEHAIHQADARELPTPELIKVAKGMIVEIETEGNRLAKVLARIAGLDSTRPEFDVVFVMVPLASGSWLVKTIYANHSADNHATLQMWRLTK